MKIYNNLNLKRKHKNSVIAIGNFDGIHLGHQKVISEAKKKARKSKLPLGVVTFEPMPVMFFNPKIKNHRINSMNQKKLQLKKLNIDFVIMIKFNKIFSRIKAEKFIKKIISEKTSAKYIFVSKNFKFGRKRQGNIHTLKKLENKYNYKTIITFPLKKTNKIKPQTIITTTDVISLKKNEFFKKGVELKKHKLISGCKA